MAFYILVVDNQREVSKAIRTGVQSLGSEFVIAAAMSGEEALLEARLQKFDLLISEVRLTGMSGVELARKLRASNPDLKTILISATLDRYIRREVTDAGIETLLQKPIEITDLLNQIESLLGIGGKTLTLPQEEATPEPEPMSISDRLSILRQELDASLALLMSDTGEVLMQAGNFQQMDIQAETSSLLAIFSAGHKISRLLGLAIPDNFYTFRGTKHDLVMTHVGEAHALVIGTLASGTTLAQMDRINQVIRRGTHDLQAILTDMGVSLTAHEEPPSEEALVMLAEDEEDIEAVFDMDQGLEALFKGGEKVSEHADLDSFWEVSSAEDTGIFTSADALSYEQARQLGLAPNEE